MRLIRLVAAAIASTYSDIAIYTKMSKRKSSGDQTGTSLSLKLDDKQVAAFELVRDSLHPTLKCLVPVLDSIREAYGDVIPPHKKALLVNHYHTA